MKVPNAENAEIEIGKLRDYCLNPNSDVGEHKARVFASALNLLRKDWETLQNALLVAVKSEDAKLGKPNNYGEVFIVEFDMTNAGKTAIVRSVWMIKPGSKNPELITCYVV
ncbi:MAG: DUF6883 domain-containing protein [Pyrinomonadaceae bacterium]